MSEEIIFGNVSEIEDNKIVSKRFGRKKIVVSSYNGNIYAFKDACTHDNAPFDTDGELNNCIITCTRHGSQFDITDGSVVRSPAITPLTMYKVNIDNDTIKILLED